jgi:hypothetical protein
MQLQHPELQAALLRHPSISQDQQAVAALLRLSKSTQAAVAQQLAGQLQVVLHARKLQQGHALVQWLRKHADLLQGLELRLVSSMHIDRMHGRSSADLTDALQRALAHTSAAGTLRLRSFTLRGISASTGILGFLPAAHLTHLDACVDLERSDALQAVGRLSQLRCLALTSLTSIRPSGAVVSLLLPLAGLQQLTELRIGPVHAVQLQELPQLPPRLQQLHLAMRIQPGPRQAQQLMQLAAWLQQHSRFVRTLELDGPNIRGHEHELQQAADAL